MPKTFAEGLFLLGFWAPPLAVALGALALLIKTPSARRTAAPSRTAALTH